MTETATAPAEDTTEAVTQVAAIVENEETNQRTISVPNPTSEEMTGICQHITANYNFDVDTKAVKFNFKKSKDKDNGIETIRESVELALPYPSVQGIVNILETGGKQLELLQEAIETVVNSAARELLYDDINLNASTFPVTKVSWDFIANIPKVQRRGGGIPKEVWEGFAEDYCKIMPEAADKNLDQVTKAAGLLKSKLANCKTNEKVLKLLVGQLAIYANASPNAEDYQECVEFLLNKADTFLNISPAELLASL